MGKFLYKLGIEKAFLNETEDSVKRPRSSDTVAVNTLKAQIIVSWYYSYSKKPGLLEKCQIPGPDQKKYKVNILFLKKKKKEGVP